MKKYFDPEMHYTVFDSECVVAASANSYEEWAARNYATKIEIGISSFADMGA